MIPGNDGLSNILGWVSIACWIVVYSPQIYENFHLKSGEGLSVPFVLTWLLGDLCNLVGAALAGLLPTVILLALYYSLCDITLLLQIYFYRWTKLDRTSCSQVPDDQREHSPLLIGSNCERERQQTISTKTLLARYLVALLFVFATGIIAWWIDKDMDNKGKVPKHLRKGLAWDVQIIGWSSAVLYLGARIPQIFKNFKTRCEGLSPALFLFAIFGNTTYALSICAKSTDRQYLITNASWLAGSGLTVFMDCIVLFQFAYYRSIDRSRVNTTTGN